MSDGHLPCEERAPLSLILGKLLSWKHFKAGVGASPRIQRDVRACITRGLHQVQGRMWRMRCRYSIHFDTNGVAC